MARENQVRQVEVQKEEFKKREERVANKMHQYAEQRRKEVNQRQKESKLKERQIKKAIEKAQLKEVEKKNHLIAKNIVVEKRQKELRKKRDHELTEKNSKMQAHEQYR